MIDETPTPPDLTGSEATLDKLFTEVTKWEGTLAGGEHLDVGGEALDSLRKTRVLFGNPRANLVALTPDQLHGSGLELTSIQKDQFAGKYDFYYLTITVDMQPRPGAHFKSLTCKLSFGPKGQEEPIVQSIFPQTNWKSVMEWGGGMTLGLDADLKWKVGVDATKLSELSGQMPELKANLENKNEMKSHIVLRDFSYDLGRFEIAAFGEDNSECYWYIQNADLQKVLTVKFGVVFKVPKGTKSVTLEGLAWAEPSMHWLIEHVRNVFADLSEKLQNLLRRREDASKDLSRGAREMWTLELPG
ncbi:MAG: hypothetical protein IPM39_15565 [Chloroflexi bacterium]|nr:hypothetical protein [Chloroflexota bacterium]